MESDSKENHEDKRSYIRELSITEPSYFDFMVSHSRFHPALFVTTFKHKLVVFSFPACKLVKKYCFEEGMLISHVKYYKEIENFVVCIQAQIVVFSLSGMRTADFTLKKTKEVPKLSVYVEPKNKGKYIYLAGDFEGIHGLNFETKAEEEGKYIPVQDQIGYLKYLKTHNWLIAAGAISGQLYIIEMEENSLLIQIPAHEVDSRISLSYSIQSNGFYLTTCNGHNKVRKWVIENDAGSFELAKDQKISKSHLNFIVPEYDLLYCVLHEEPQGIKLDLKTLKVLEEANRHKKLCHQLKKYFYRLSQ